MKVEDISFRDVYRQICLLTGANVVAAVNARDIFDFPPDEKFDGFLAYATIADEIFGFEILAGAQVVGNRIKIFPGSYKKSVRLKRAQADNVDLKIVTAEYALPFRDRLALIDDRIASEREQTRRIKTLDAFRHPDYPDDVVVYFMSAAHKPELLWVRCLSIDENILTGELLIEPRNDFDCHAGDEIKFGVAQVNGQNILLHLPTKAGVDDDA